MTDTRKAMADAYALLVDLRLSHKLKYEHPAIDRNIEALREALAQQGDCQCADQRDCTGACCVSKQQGEQQPWRNGYDEGYTAGRMRSEMIGQEAKAYKEAYFKLLEQVASLKALEPAPPVILQAAPAAQPLTDERIEELFQSAADADEEVHIRFARAVEAAHGIGADK